VSAKGILSSLGAFVAKPSAPRQEVIGFAPAEAKQTIALKPFRSDGRVLESPLPEVSNEAFTDFVFAMKVAPLEAVSPSNGLGMFDMRYKRLADLGLVTNLRYRRDLVTNRSVQEADWVAPLDPVKFLRSAPLQYRVFVESVKRYSAGLRAGEIEMPKGGMPSIADGAASGVTESGCLAILHRGGPSALRKWNEEQFEKTRELFLVANGHF
jgi:hypothetical protein